MCENLLNVAMWNIEGLSADKINDPHFCSCISKFDILSLVETWANESDDNVSLPGFCTVDSNYRKKNIKMPGAILVVLQFLLEII